MKKRITGLFEYIKGSRKRLALFTALLTVLLAIPIVALALDQPKHIDPAAQDSQQTTNQSHSVEEKVAGAKIKPKETNSQSNKSNDAQDSESNSGESSARGTANNTSQTPWTSTVTPVESGNPRVLRAAFINPRIYCEHGQQFASVQTMRVYATNISKGFTMKWRWESSLPSFTHDYESYVHTTVFPAGSKEPLWLPDAQTFPILFQTSEGSGIPSGMSTAPAHSLRIHILSPGNAYTEWFNIPKYSTTVRLCQ